MNKERYCGVCRAIINQVGMCPYCSKMCCPFCDDPMELDQGKPVDYYCRRCDEIFALRLFVFRDGGEMRVDNVDRG